MFDKGFDLESPVFDRRVTIAGLAAVFSLAGAATRARAVDRDGDILRWVFNVEKLSAGLREGAVSASEWQDGLVALSNNIPLVDILSLIDFDALVRRTPFAEQGVATSPVRLPTVDGVSRNVYTKLFAVGDRRAVIPHGHIGMVSGHLVLKGAFHLRQYDRVAVEDGHWLIRQTIDRREETGALSTISDERDNIHWLIADGPAYTLDFIMAPALHGDEWMVQNLDIEAAESANGVLRAPTLGVVDALKKYGVHHRP